MVAYKNMALTHCHVIQTTRMMKRSRPEEETAKWASTSTSPSSSTMKKPMTGDLQHLLVTALGDQLAQMVDNPHCTDIQLLAGPVQRCSG
jgi:hypothetical protein